MSNYIKQTWNTYDHEQSIQRNIERNAIVTDDNMNHIEEGVAKGNRKLITNVRTGAKKFAVDIREQEESILFDFSFPDTVTDMQLELRGIPADAKATGDAMDALRYGIEILQQRMNTINKLPEGSTSGDAELADIRITVNGDTYSTAGDAVRAQFNELSSAIDIMRDSLNEGNGVASISNNDSYEPLES